jgi:hypothetical protein
MEISLAGWIGAVAGAAIGVTNYLVFVAALERALRVQDKSQTGEEREAFERKLSVMRRTILGLDILVFAAGGYWLGQTFGG